MITGFSDAGEPVTKCGGSTFYGYTPDVGPDGVATNVPPNIQQYMDNQYNTKCPGKSQMIDPESGKCVSVYGPEDYMGQGEPVSNFKSEPVSDAGRGLPDLSRDFKNWGRN
jgi:hypothetical protein